MAESPNESSYFEKRFLKHVRCLKKEKAYFFREQNGK